MKKFDIYADSGANIPDSIVDEYNINVVPFTCVIDGVETPCYKKGQSSREMALKFYAAMREGCDTSTTLINCDKFYEAIEPSLKKGNDVIITTISSGISGTYKQACAAAERAMENYPELKVHVFDAYNASMGEGLFTLAAARMRNENKTYDEVCSWLEANKLNMHSVFTVSDLKYLKKGGRVSATKAIAGTLLNIKPVLVVGAHGTIEVAETVRGRKKALARLAEMFGEEVVNPSAQTISICHADCEDDANYLADLIRAKGASDIIIEVYDICTGSHVGPGTVALFFMGEDRSVTLAAKEKNSVIKNIAAKFRRGE